MSQKPKIPNLLDSLTPKEVQQLKSHNENVNGGFPIDDYWLTLAEIATLFGWQAYIDAKNDNVENVTSKEMYTLLAAARRLRALEIDNMVQAGLIVNHISYSKNPKSKIASYQKKLKKNLEVND